MFIWCLDKIKSYFLLLSSGFVSVVVQGTFTRHFDWACKTFYALLHRWIFKGFLVDAYSNIKPSVFSWIVAHGLSGLNSKDKPRNRSRQILSHVLFDCLQVASTQSVWLLKWNQQRHLQFNQALMPSQHKNTDHEFRLCIHVLLQRCCFDLMCRSQ